jgi:hypothetical protein
VAQWRAQPGPLLLPKFHSVRKATVKSSTLRVIGEPKEKTSLVILLAVYGLAWGSLLRSVGGIWWDDWTLVGTSPDGILEAFRQSGMPWNGLLHLVLAPIAPHVYHILSFFSFLGVGLLVWAIMASIPHLRQWERLYVAAIVLVVPMNAARHTMITLPYTISLLLFYLAWYVLTRSPNPSKSVLAMAGLLFLTSFNTNSLLSFFLIPISHLWWIRHSAAGESLVHFTKSYWPLMSLPFVYFGMKSIWFTPYGAFEGYNSLSVDSALVGLMPVVAAGLPLVIVTASQMRAGKMIRSIFFPACAGLLFVGLAVFPYIAVGHYPPYGEWATRHELLMPLGIAIFSLSGVRLISVVLNERVAGAFAILTVLAFVVLSARIGNSYYLDWQKQQGLIGVLAENNVIETSRLVVFIDQTTQDNMFNSPYRFYAWTGLMRYAFDNATRFGINAVDLPRYLDGGYRQFYGPGTRLDYGASEFFEPSHATIATITMSGSGDYTISTENVPVASLRANGDVLP